MILRMHHNLNMIAVMNPIVIVIVIKRKDVLLDQEEIKKLVIVTKKIKVQKPKHQVQKPKHQVQKPKHQVHKNKDHNHQLIKKDVLLDQEEIKKLVIVTNTNEELTRKIIFWTTISSRCSSFCHMD